MTPEIVYSETIKPSSPTPDARRCFKLSLQDSVNTRVRIPVIFFFACGSEDPDKPVDLAERSCRIKTSLSETLTRYYPLAGRIKDAGNIECNDEGVDFVVARVDCRLEGFLVSPEIEALNLFSPDQVQGDKPDMILAVRVTFFKCGGMAIGVSMSHKLGDLASLSTFVNHWALMARQPGEEISAQFITSSFPRNDSLTFPEPKAKKVNRVTRRFVFTASKLEELKALASSHGVKNPTRVQLTSALIYKCAIAASRAISESRKPSIYFNFMNLRRVVIPALPDKSFGNMAWYALTSSTEESRLELHGLVGQLQEDFARTRLNFRKSFSGDEWTSHICELMKETGTLLSGVATNHTLLYSCTSWCRFPLYTVDFGWGNPIWVGTPVSIYNSSILLDTRSGEGIEALVTLAESDMNVLEQDEELLRFASLNPRVLDGH